jgi:hypothetical protein
VGISGKALQVAVPTAWTAREMLRRVESEGHSGCGLLVTRGRSICGTKAVNLPRQRPLDRKYLKKLSLSASGFDLPTTGYG